MDAVTVGDMYDVVVVGAGIMGSSSAYECAKRGLRVLLLEQFDFLHRKGSSHGESRIIRRTYPEDWYTEMMPSAYRLWEEASKEAGYSPLTITGSLDFGSSELTDLKELMAACHKHSVPHQVMSAEELRKRYPAFTFPKDTVGVFCEEGGILHATKACSMFQQLAVKHGAKVMDRVKIISVKRQEHEFAAAPPGSYNIVETTRGDFLCRACVLACGAWTAPLVKAICGIDLPVQPLQVYVAYWRVHEEWVKTFQAQEGCPVFLNYGVEDHVYGMPVLDYPGLVKISSHNGWPCDPNNRPSGPPPVVGPMQKWLGQWLEGKVDTDPALVEACMYSMTPDQDFILDVLPADNAATEVAQGRDLLPGCIVVAAGFSGHGFKFGPLIGSIVADLVQTGTSSQAPMERFSMRRFENGSPGNLRPSGPQVKTLPPVK